MRVLAENKYEHGQSAIDLATPLHFLIGIAAGIYGVSPVKAALFFTVAKIGVASVEKSMDHALFRRKKGESNLNELCDLLAEIGGVDVGARIRSKWNPSPVTPTAGLPIAYPSAQSPRSKSYP
jgi:hypothetical protein